MALKYKVGDLCDALANSEIIAIGHQANCFNTMNSGVAKAIRARWPTVYTADCETTKGDRDKLGTFSMEAVRDGGIIRGFVYNLYGQYNYGYDAKGYTDYESLRNALVAMREDLVWLRSPINLGFPKIGAGLGGGDWGTISAIIEDVFDDRFAVTIYVLREEDKC